MAGNRGRSRDVRCFYRGLGRVRGRSARRADYADIWECKGVWTLDAGDFWGESPRARKSKVQLWTHWTLAHEPPEISWRSLSARVPDGTQALRQGKTSDRKEETGFQRAERKAAGARLSKRGRGCRSARGRRWRTIHLRWDAGRPRGARSSRLHRRCRWKAQGP